MSALFAAEGRGYSKHSAVESAVHRDLVRAGRVEQEFGKSLSMLSELRGRGDYGGAGHVTHEAAADAISMASRLLDTTGKLAGFSRS